jgi:hypothetical protein
MSTPEITKHGQKDFPVYFGPTRPEFIFNNYRNSLSFVDDELVNNYFQLKMGGEFGLMNEFFNNELYIGMNCPDQAYINKYSYIKYLNRLQVLSYLFQSMREHEYNMKKLNLNSLCQVDWTRVTASCNPKSSEMKNFLTSARVAIKSLSDIVVSFDEVRKFSTAKWAKDYNKGNRKSLTQIRVSEYCGENGCEKISAKNFPGYVKKVCSEEKELFKTICSEKDSLYGGSWTPEIYYLIARSQGIRGINEDGYAKGCIERFIHQNKNIEKKMPAVQNIFSVLFDFNMSNSPEIPQGRFFTIGAIKEFTDKGLAAIFSPTKVKVKKTQPKKFSKVVKLSNPEFKEIILPKFEKEKVVKLKKKTVKKKAKVVIKKSSYLVASEFREQFNLDKVKLDMKKFKFDYVFTLSMEKVLTPMIKKYSSIKSLRSMKLRDELGSKKSPVPLRFIKFLIDKKMNQNLYNIINTIGDKFYVFNDIDKGKKRLDYIQVNNDVSTNFMWNVQILKYKNKKRVSTK